MLNFLLFFLLLISPNFHQIQGNRSWHCRLFGLHLFGLHDKPILLGNSRNQSW
jgi:hypothetical protein